MRDAGKNDEKGHFAGTRFYPENGDIQASTDNIRGDGESVIRSGTDSVFENPK